MQAVNSNTRKELEKTASETAMGIEPLEAEQPPAAVEVDSLAVALALPAAAAADVVAVVVGLVEVDVMKQEEEEAKGKTRRSFWNPWWRRNSADRACKRR